MKKILIFSDSHGNTDKMIEIIRQNPTINTIIFLGDGIRDIENIGRIFPYLNIIEVPGNNDFLFNTQTEQLLTIGNKKVFITHGHNYGVKYGDTKIINEAKKYGADILIYAHTHEAVDKMQDNILILNPGSIGYYPYSYIEIEIGEKIIEKIKFA